MRVKLRWTLTHHRMLVYYFCYKWGGSCSPNDSEVANNASLIRLTKVLSAAIAVFVTAGECRAKLPTQYLLVYLDLVPFMVLESRWRFSCIVQPLLVSLTVSASFPGNQLGCTAPQNTLQWEYNPNDMQTSCPANTDCLTSICLQRADVGASTDGYGVTGWCFSWATVVISVLSLDLTCCFLSFTQ